MARKSGSDPRMTGARIRASAECLIARHGHAAVSMRQIAADAGVQAGSIYLYFADKQALLFELMNAHMDELLTAWRAVPRPVRPMVRLQRFIGFHIPFHLDRPDAVFISQMELRNLTPENFAVIEGKRREYEAELESILKDGHEAGVFEYADLRLTTMAIMAMLNGVNTWYREGGRLRQGRVVRVYWRLARRMVLNPVSRPDAPAQEEEENAAD